MLNSELFLWMQNLSSQTNDLTAENKKNERANEDLFLPVVGLVTEENTSKTFEQHIPSESVLPEELVSEESSEKTVEDVLFQPKTRSKEETSLPKPLLTPEEEAATWKDYRGPLFGKLNRESAFYRFYGSEKKDPLRQTDAGELKTSNSISEYERSRSNKQRKIQAAALAEEISRKQKFISEQAGRMRKNRLVLLGIGLILLISLVTVSFSSFKSAHTAPEADPKLNVVISPDNDNYVNKYRSDDIEILVSYSENIDNEDSDDIAVIESEDMDELSGKLVSSEPDDPFIIISEGSVQAMEQDGLSSGTIDLIEIGAGMADSKESPVSGNDKIEVQRTAGETRRTTAAGMGKTAQRASTRADRRDSSSSIALTRKTPPRSPGIRQDKIYSAMKSEKYVDAINLSKSNLERNSTDKLSFFSLGLALYATSNFSGATEAFYACFKFNDPSLPDFLVEEFDSHESLMNLYINYPGVDLLIRAVELNPKNKSLYINLFLSNIKSEKPRAASEIYTVILNHARKHGPNTK